MKDHQPDRDLMSAILGHLRDAEHNTLGVWELGKLTMRHPKNVRQACYDLEAEGAVYECQTSVYELAYGGDSPGPGSAA